MARSLLEILININKQGTGATQAEKELSGLEKTTKGLNNVLGVFGLALTTKAVLDFTNASREANRLEKDSLNTLKEAAKGVDDYAKALQLGREATKGMASDQQIAAAEGTLFGAGLAKTSEEAAQLATAGTVLSGVFASAGASQELFVRLLSSGSPVLFNNFGLTNQMVQAQQKLIESTTNLTGEEAKSQALKEVLIAQAQKYQGALSQETIQAQQAAAAQQNFTAAFGGLVNEIDKATGATGLTTWFLNLETEGAKAWGTVFEGVGALSAMNREAVAASGAMDQYRISTGQATQAQIDAEHAAADAAAAQEDVTRAAADAAAAAEAELAALGPLNSSQIATGHSADIANAGEQALARGMLAARDAAREHEQALADLRAGLQETTAAQQSNADLRAAKEEAPELGARITANRQAVFEINQQKEEEEGRSNERTAKANERAAKQMATSFKQAADEIGNTISSKLSTTFEEVFKLPDGAADHADEPARRLATVAASGFGSEWLTQLNAQFAGQDFWQPITAAMQSGNGEQLKTAATGILQQFSQGLITNLFDVNVIRGQVRAEMVQKRLKEQLIEEVKQGLGAEGISQAIGVVEVAAGNVGVATAQTETNVSTMAATAKTAGGEMKTSFDAPLTSVNTLILRIAELNKMLERTKVLAGEAGSAIGGLNPPAPGASLVPNGADKKMGGPSQL